jgi:hypothetical protein
MREPAGRRFGQRHRFGTRLGRNALRRDQGSAGPDRGRLEQDRDRKINGIRFFDHRKQANSDQGMPAKVKETVIGANLTYPQKVRPEPCQFPFDIVRWRDIITVELRPVKALIGFCPLDQRSLRHQRGQVQ